ncbi:MAG: hypothetical protein U0894_11155 [Pirellulales bacterium]
MKRLNVIEKKLERFGPLQYHGQIPSKQPRPNPQTVQGRQVQACHPYELSGAGSVGLNPVLRVRLPFDRWWNPAIEDQVVNGVIESVPQVPSPSLACWPWERLKSGSIKSWKISVSFLVTVMGEPGVPSTPPFAVRIFGSFNLRTPKGPIKAVA